MMKRFLAIFIAITMVMVPMGFSHGAGPEINCPNNHIIPDDLPGAILLHPPDEERVVNFTVGHVADDGSSWIPPTNDYFTGITSFYFVTGDSDYAPGGPNNPTGNGTRQVVRASGVYDAIIIYTPILPIWNAPRAQIASWSIPDVALLPVEFFSRQAGAAANRANATFFFDEGRWIDRDYLDNNNLSGDNTSIVGLYRDANGESLTTIFKAPAPCGAVGTIFNQATNFAFDHPGATTPRTLRWRFNTPSNYVENIIFDGSGLNMSPNNGVGSGSRGAYFIHVGVDGNTGLNVPGGASDFVFKDVIIQNVGATNTTVNQGPALIAAANVAGNQRNVAINVLRITYGTRHFDNLTVRNVRTTGYFAVMQFNQTQNTYFRNLCLEGNHPLMHANAHPIKIENNVTQSEIDQWLGGNLNNQRDIIFDGTLTLPNRNSMFDGVYIQDYRYRNILLPANFEWALLKAQNGEYNQPAIIVFDNKKSPVANITMGLAAVRRYSALQLSTGYWFVEAEPFTHHGSTNGGALQAQLDHINAVINFLANPAGAVNTQNTTTPMRQFEPNVKMIATSAGTLPGFTIPNFVESSTIVALHQTATPGATLYPALAHARGGNTADDDEWAWCEFVQFTGNSGITNTVGVLTLPTTLPGEHRIFNFDFKNPTRNWTIGDSVVQSDGSQGHIHNFVQANSGRNLFFRSVPLITKESGSIVNGDFVPFNVNDYVMAGDTVTYKITVTNPSDVTKENIRVEDLIDTSIFDVSGTLASIIITDSTGAPATGVTPAVNQVTGLLSVDIEELEADENIIIMFEVVVLPNVAPQTVINTARLFFDDEFVDEDIATVRIVDTTLDPNVSIIKTAVSGTTVAPGGTVVYELVITNTGNVPLTQLVVTDDLLSAGLTWSSTALPTGATDLSTPSMLEVVLAELAPGESATIIFTATADSSLQNGDNIINTAVVVDNITFVDDSDTETVEVEEPTEPNVSIVKAADRSTTMSGQTITYTLIVTNTGNVDLNDLVVTDTLPVQLENLIVISMPPNATDFSTSDVLEIELDSLASGAYVTITFTAVVVAGLANNTDIINTAHVVAEAYVVGALPIDVSNSDTETVQVLAPGVSIAKAATPTNPQPGGTVNYTLTVTNTGGVPLTSLVVTDTLPAQLTNPDNLVVPVGSTNYGFTGQTLSVTLPTLAPGASVTITFSATIVAATPRGTSITNIANIADEDTAISASASVTVTIPTATPPGNGGGGGQPPVVEIPEEDPPLAEMSPYHYAYIIGYPDGYVRPERNITRAEVATIFFRLISDEHRVDIWSQSNPFPDVILQNWFNNAISTLTNANLLYGYPDGYFRPNQSMTRAEFSAVIVRIMGQRGAMDTATNSFSDVSGHWGEAYISVAYELGWVRGYPDGTFRPNQLITRAEVAALVNRALNRLPETPDDLLPGMVEWPDNMNINSWYYLYMQEATNSHYHEMKANGINETWTELIEPREWWRLERPNSDPRIFTGAYIGDGMGMIED